MPCDPRNRASSSMRVRMRRSLVSSQTAKSRRPLFSDLLDGMKISDERRILAEKVADALANVGEAVDDLGRNHARRAQGQEPNHRADLEPARLAARQVQDIVEE